MVKTPSFDRLGTSVSSRVLGVASLDRVVRKTLIGIALVCSLFGGSASLTAGETVNINTDSAEVLSAAGVRLGDTYPHPIVDHKTAREAALSAYGTLKSLD